MSFEDTIKRRIVRSFGDPATAFKIYDSLGEDPNVEALIGYMEAREIPGYAFAGVRSYIPVSRKWPNC